MFSMVYLFTIQNLCGFERIFIKIVLKIAYNCKWSICHRFNKLGGLTTNFNLCFTSKGKKQLTVCYIWNLLCEIFKKVSKNYFYFSNRPWDAIVRYKNDLVF